MILRRNLLAAPLLLSALPARAQSPVPGKPIRFVVGFSAGGGTDTVARLIAARLTDLWHQSVVVENRAGAGGRNRCPRMLPRAVRPATTTQAATSPA